MTKRPAFQFYPGDWLADMRIRMLPWASRGLYMELLCYCWREDWIPADSSAIAQLCGCHDLAIVEPCLQLFQPHPSDSSKLIHQRLVEEKLKQDQYREERSLSGKRGAKLRWDSGMRENTGAAIGDSSANGSAISSAINQPMAKNSSSSSTSTSNTSSKEEVGADRKKSYLLNEEFWSEMRRHYPDIDVDAESRKMDAWLLARPGRKKTRQFVINWLNKVEPALAPAKAKEVDLTW
jgi:hypothetical protein